MLEGLQDIQDGLNLVYEGGTEDEREEEKDGAEEAARQADFIKDFEYQAKGLGHFQGSGEPWKVLSCRGINQS